ncbi:MAG: ABC transporter ATP-binding protein [Tissierellia bacterium]|nr:ABC transporter ATP-binding protein [Tissierellia bacterium]
MKNFIKLRDFFKEHKWNYIFGILALLIIDSIQLLIPQILRKVTDLLEAGLLDLKGLLKYSLLILMTGFLIAAGRYIWRIYIFGTSRKMEHYLRNMFFEHLLTLSPNYYNTHKTGDLMAHATNDINAVRQASGQGIMMAVDATFLIILSMIMMAKTTNIKLTLVALATLPFITVTVNKFGKVIYKRFTSVQEAFSDLTDTTQENFAGIRVIKSFVQEDLALDEFTRVNEENLDKNLALVKVSGIFHPLVQFVSSLSFLIVIIYGGRLVMLDTITLGDFIAFNNYLGLLIWPMMAVGWVVNVIQRGVASMERLNAILDEKAEIIDRENPIPLNSPRGKIEFRNVEFQYPGTKDSVLKDINFTIEEGKTLAIVGRTGSGKTTLVNLLLRLYDIEKGEIFLDNINIKDIKIKDLRENIAYVPQDNFLFSTTIKNNIGFAFDEEISDDEAIKAAKAAEVYNNIIEFPNSFNTVLGERGVTLSGGQKQRVSIARALAKDAPILILDDSLSSVDPETEEKILNNLEELANRKTTIIISHRISTIQNADEIIVIDNGHIVERGTHDILVKNDGLYNYLYEKQLLEEKIS